MSRTSGLGTTLRLREVLELKMFQHFFFFSAETWPKNLSILFVIRISFVSLHREIAIVRQ